MGQRTGAHHEDCMNSITPRVKPNNIKLVLGVILVVFNCVFCHVCDYTVTVSFHSLYMNQVPERLYYVHD
jgi:hypothetical protein